MSNNYGSFLSEYGLKPNCFDEVFDENRELRSQYNNVKRILSSVDIGSFESLNQKAKLDFLNQGITYALYTANESTETIFPFDLMPRIIDCMEWQRLEKGLLQRNKALNLFIFDVYHDRNIIKEGIIPERLVNSSNHYTSLMEGFDPIGGIYCHISGTDLIKHSDGQFYVLEDNLRNPSGVSYVLSNRVTLSRTLPQLFQGQEIYQVEQYPYELLNTFNSVSPNTGDPICVLLTPGQYNSAYYEHSILAKMMGIDLVEAGDLFVDKDVVYMNSIGGRQRVDVIYRRIDDDFLDPKHFRSDSLLGVYGLVDAYLKHNVNIVNAIGTGVSDDKAICSYVPDMIKYYLNEDPIIPNVPTYICEREEDLAYTLDNLQSMVIKPVDMSGGYGVTIADTLKPKELDELKKKIIENPREYIAQPKMMLSTHATYIEETQSFEPRHIDLRTFTLMGDDRVYILPGGLSRVALKRDSLIVNSSQGGGSKDTWVLMR